MTDKEVVGGLPLSHWKKTVTSLDSFNDRLKCKLCNQIFREPVTLNTCGHTYCRQCCQDCSECPQCKVPLWIKDIRPAYKLATIVNATTSIERLVTVPFSPPDPSPLSKPENFQDSENHAVPMVFQREMVKRPLKRSEPVTCQTVVKRRRRGVLKDIQVESSRGGKTEESAATDGVAISFVTSASGGSLVQQPDNSCRRMTRQRFRELRSSSFQSGQLEAVSSFSSTDPKGGQRSEPVTCQTVVKRRRRGVLKDIQVASSRGGKTEESATTDGVAISFVTSASGAGLVQQPDNSCRRMTRQRFRELASRSFRSGQLEAVSSLSSTNPKSGRRKNTRIVKSRPAKKTKKTTKVHQSGLTVGQKFPSSSNPVQDPYSSFRVKCDPVIKITSSSKIFTDDTSDTEAPVSRRKRKAMEPLEQTLLKRRLTRPVTGTKNKKGETRLHRAAIKGNRFQAEMLLDLGEDPNYKDNAGWTPLHDASHQGHTPVVELLLDRGALVDTPGYYNNTALHEAVAQGSADVALLLLRHGASPGLKNSCGQTAREMGCFQWIDDIFSINCSNSRLNKPTPKPLHASPKLNGGLSRVVILGTRLRPCHKVTLAEAASRLNAEVVTEFSQDVTHVITYGGAKDSCLRTYKLLCGIATGKWILKFEWIEESLSQLQWMDETTYEVYRVRTKDGTGSLAACKRARENQLFGAPGLFDGCHFYLHGSYPPPQPSRDELASLLRMSGANLLTREPATRLAATGLQSYPYHTNAACKRNVFILVDDVALDSPKLWKWRVMSNDEKAVVATVSVGWLLDCLTQFQLLPIRCQ